MLQVMICIAYFPCLFPITSLCTFFTQVSKAWLKITLSKFLDLGFLEFDHIHVQGFPCNARLFRRRLLYPTEPQPQGSHRIQGKIFVSYF